MKSDFKKMEEEMDRLATNMDTIADFSEKISSTLQDRREQITKLSGVHSLLKKVTRQNPWQGLDPENIGMTIGTTMTEDPVSRSSCPISNGKP